jgi:CheY-like chemotaxis protein
MADKPRVLCVDDEPNVLEGLSLTLRRRYDVVTAPGGAEGLEVLGSQGTFAVVISDMRMPGMDGAAFLSRARGVAPDSVRLVLTGQADIETAITAVNDGQLFRFLTKPCPPAVVLAAVDAAAEQHRLITAERVLLEQTLHGSIKALTDVLALVSPASFGRATRIKRLVSELAEKVGLEPKWQVEVAAMLSQIGYLSLPAETAERVYDGRPLSAEEQKAVARIPDLTQELLGSIPRLETVREILVGSTKPFRKPTGVAETPARQLVARGSELLKVAIEFDALDSVSATSGPLAIEPMRARGRYDPDILAVLATIRGTDRTAREAREIPTADLRVGMTLAEDVKAPNGVLLVARGYEVSARLLERVRSFPAGVLEKKLWRVVS